MNIYLVLPMLIMFRGVEACLQDQRDNSAYSEVASEWTYKRQSYGSPGIQ
jgi:hypothetical protein